MSKVYCIATSLSLMAHIMISATATQKAHSSGVMPYHLHATNYRTRQGGQAIARRLSLRIPCSPCSQKKVYAAHRFP